MNLKLVDRKYYTDEKFTIVRKKNSESEAIHTHDFVELVYIFKGKSVHMVDGEEYSLTGGDALLINYGCEHSFSTVDCFEYADIIIKPEYINSSLKGVYNAFSLLSLNGFKEFSSLIDSKKRLIHFSTEEQKKIETLIEIVENEQSCGDAGGDLIRHSIINTILTMVFRKMSFKLKERMNIDSELLAYISENCSEPLSLKKVSDMCFCNPSYFSRAFKNFAGVTFSEYLLKTRIKKACNLLEKDDIKIETVMEKCGLSNRTRFYESFLKETGLTPLNYKKSKKQIHN